MRSCTTAASTSAANSLRQVVLAIALATGPEPKTANENKLERISYPLKAREHSKCEGKGAMNRHAPCKQQAINLLNKMSTKKKNKREPYAWQSSLNPLHHRESHRLGT